MSQQHCPTCGKQFVVDVGAPSFPFCCDRCRMVDLGRWLNEDIGLPHAASEEEEELADESTSPVREWKFE